MSNKFFIILPVTLFEKTPDFFSAYQPVILEHPVYFGKIGKSVFKFSKPKLAYTKATLLAFAQYLADNNIPYSYIPLEKYSSFRSTLNHADITFFDPVDKVVVADLQKAARSATVLEAPNFLTSENDMQWYVENKPNRNYFHKHFYEWQRKRTGILMQNGKPIGGKYSYDPENRKSLPRGHVAPDPPRLSVKDSAYWQQAAEWVEKNFPKAPGVLRDDALRFPVTYNGVRAWLKQFIDIRLNFFGAYEDAIAQHQPLLYHSGCSPMLLVGLLTPQQILKELFSVKRDAPLAAVEGYVRQLISWREWTRMIYVHESSTLENSNFLKANRKLKKCWYDGTTGIDLVDDAIKDAFSDGYLHHIRRLMGVGNIMLITGVHPHEIFKWFLEFAVDASVWLMIFNTLDMIAYSTGGLTTSKPYCSGSNYLIKMSNYPKGPWCDIWDALYYEFWRKHYKKLKGVRQAQFAIGNLSRKSLEEKKHMKKIALQFIKKTTTSI